MKQMTQSCSYPYGDCVYIYIYIYIHTGCRIKIKNILV